MTPDINKMSLIISGFFFKNMSPSFARLITFPFSHIYFGILIKNSNATKAIAKLPISKAITVLSPPNEYNAVAIKGFNIDISEYEKERRPLVC